MTIGTKGKNARQPCVGHLRAFEADFSVQDSQVKRDCERQCRRARKGPSSNTSGLKATVMYVQKELGMRSKRKGGWLEVQMDTEKLPSEDNFCGGT